MSEFYGALNSAAPCIFLEITGDSELRGRGCVVWIGNHGTRRVKRRLTDPFRPMSILIPITVCTPSKVHGLSAISVASLRLREEMTVRRIKRTDREGCTPRLLSLWCKLPANILNILLMGLAHARDRGHKKAFLIYISIGNILMLHFKSGSVAVSAYRRGRSQSNVRPFMSYLSLRSLISPHHNWTCPLPHTHTHTHISPSSCESCTWAPGCAVTNNLHYSSRTFPSHCSPALLLLVCNLQLTATFAPWRSSGKTRWGC